MNEARAQELVVGCLAASAVVASGSALADGNLPGIRLVVGLGFTGVGLATAAMFAPRFAGGMAALILTTTVFLYGRPFMDAVTGLTAAPSTTPTATTVPNRRAQQRGIYT